MDPPLWPMMGSPARSILHALPPESLLQVVKEIGPEDYLSMKLTCRTFSNYLDRSLIDFMRSRSPLPSIVVPGTGWLRGSNWKDLVVAFHKKLECSINLDHPERQLQQLLCSDCGAIRPVASFADDRRKHFFTTSGKWAIKYRRCLHCHRKRLREARSPSPWICGTKPQETIKIDGVNHFLCRVCDDLTPVAATGDMTTPVNGPRRRFERRTSGRYKPTIARKMEGLPSERVPFMIARLLSGYNLFGTCREVKARRWRACKKCIDKVLQPAAEESWKYRPSVRVVDWRLLHPESRPRGPAASTRSRGTASWLGCLS